MKWLVCWLAGLLMSGGAVADDWLVKQQVKGGFDEVKEAVVNSIENRGLVINYTAHIAEMLKRTGADIGATKQIFDRAEIIEFCSARLSRQMMEADPHNIVLCPFSLSVYSLPGEDGKVWISYRRAGGVKAQPVHDLLRGIVTDATR